MFTACIIKLLSTISGSRLRRQEQYGYRRRLAPFCCVCDAGELPAVQRIPSPLGPLRAAREYAFHCIIGAGG